ncbi:MAG: uracil-DNA glycosylase [Flavobacteriales bacterium]|nr:uracil-DNA glycosylase [Flavobacteriales bacterium]
MEDSKLNKKVQIHDTWYQVLKNEFEKPYFLKLKDFLTSEKSQYVIYPPGPLIFNAFNSTPFDQVKIVLIGQDPYHGAGQAEGLSFSVPRGIKPPPSLVNIYKELKDDLGLEPPRHGHLGAWAHQGVLLLNAVLTVRAGQPGSHRAKGWELFTDQVIRSLSELREHLVFFLWGKYAHDKAALINESKHLVLKAAHPSPYSAASGFFGCKHFSKANAYLVEHGIQPINWKLN